MGVIRCDLHIYHQNMLTCMVYINIILDIFELQNFSQGFGRSWQAYTR